MLRNKFNKVFPWPGYNGDFADDVLGFDPNGGGIYDIPVVGDVADAVVNSFVGNVVAFAFPPAAPFIYAAKSAQALASGNELGALLNAVGAYTAYTSPTPTTTGNLAGMEISGVNANLVDATKLAMSEGASITDVAKTLVGMGNQQAAADVLKQAGADNAAAMDALNAAGQEAANYVPTAADAAQSVRAMQQAGFSQEMIQSQIGNYAEYGINTSNIAQEMANIGIAPSVAGLDAPISNVGDNLTQTFPYQSTPQVGTGTPLEPLPGTEIGYTDAEYAAMDSYGLDNYAVSPEEAGINSYLYDPMYADYPEGLGEAVDVGNVPANAGVPEGGWPADYGSEWGIGAPIGVGLTDLGLGGLQNPQMASLQNSAGAGGQSSGGGGGSAGGAGQGGSGGGGLADLLGAGLNFWNTQEGADRLAQIAQDMDPYWDYRGGTQIPMMQQAASSAGTLGNLYQQSYTDPLSVYNRPEMQALNAQFMQDIERKDAALGRNSQYGARGVQAQNNFLTNTLPQYRTGLQQGLGTLYNAATPQPYDQGSAQAALLQSTIAQNQQLPALLSMFGGASGSESLQPKPYTGGGGSSTLGDIQNVVNTGQSLVNAGNTINNAWNTVSGWF